MNPEDTSATKRKLVDTAKLMLVGEMPLIEGCRRICALRDHIDDPDNPVFLTIEGVESETDHFPLGKLRDQCAPEYLKRVDEEMERYLADAREDILKACREIIRVFSP